MIDVEDLYAVFIEFCNFGSSRNLASIASGSITDLNNDPTMDGSKFAKFCRDTKLIGGPITTTEVDIIFNKVKPKNLRRIDFAQFQDALRLISLKKFSNKKTPTEAYDSLLRFILNNGAQPLAQATSTSNDDITRRLTDTTKYTGTHKHRFDDDGVGRGAIGRDSVSKTADLSQLVNREPANIRGVPVTAAKFAAAAQEVKLPSGNNSARNSVTQRPPIPTTTTTTTAPKPVSSTSFGSLSNLASKPLGSVSNISKPVAIAPKPAAPAVRQSMPPPQSTGAKRGHVTTVSTEQLDRQANAPKKQAEYTSNSNLAASKKPTNGSGSVFDRLTDHQQYTGSHKHRFNADGTGKGSVGRDLGAKGAGTRVPF